MSLLYFAFFVVIVNNIRTRQEINSIISRIILAGFFVSVLGIFQHLLGAQKIYWVKDVTGASFFGPFINENHFSFYISLTAFITLGNIFANVFGDENIPQNNSPREVISAALNCLLEKGVLFACFSFSIMVTALFLAKSRASLLFLSSGLIFFIVSVSFRKKRKILWLILLMVVMTCALLGELGVDRVLKEIATIFNPAEYVERMAIYTDAFHLLKSHPFIGIGVGAFANVFALYRSTLALLFYRHLHNDVFQFMVEGGIIASGVILVLLGVFLQQLFIAVKTGSSYKYYMLMAIIASFFYAFLYSLIDFGLRINAVSSLLVIILSLSLLIAHLQPLGNDLSVNMKIKKIAIKKVKKPFLYIFLVLILAYSTFLMIKPLIADVLTKRAKDIVCFQRAIKLDSKNDTLYHRYYHFVLKQAAAGRIKEDIAYAYALAAINKAIQLNPHHTNYTITKGWLNFLKGDYAKAVFLLKQASLAEPQNPRIQLIYAYVLFWQWFDVKEPEKKEILLKKALIYYKNAFSLENDIRFYSVIKDKHTFELLKRALEKKGISVE